MKMTKRDADDLDAIVHLLAIEDDCITPVEAIQAMIGEIEILRECEAGWQRRFEIAIDWMKQQCTYPCSPETECVCDSIRSGTHDPS
jgi:hypothetical protein